MVAAIVNLVSVRGIVDLPGSSCLVVIMSSFEGLIYETSTQGLKTIEEIVLHLC